MTAKGLDLVIPQGADFYQEVDIPTTIDLEGLQLAMQFRDAYGNPTALLTLTTENGGLLINLSTRKAGIVIDARVAAAFYVGKYVEEIKAREASGKITSLYQGTATVTPEVTIFDFDEVVTELGALLLQTGRYELLENGTRLLLETGDDIPDLLLETGFHQLLQSGGRLLLEM